MLSAGDTFIGFGAHLYVIVDGPNDDGEVLCVNLTEARTISDTTTLCCVGDHPYIQKDSIVNYEQAKYFPANRIQELIKSGELKRHKPCCADLLRRIRAGFAKSEFTANRAKEHAQKAGW